MGPIRATVEAENQGYDWTERTDVQRWMAGLMCSAGPHPTIRHILLTIAVRMAENGDKGFPGMRTLEKRTGLSQRTIVDRLDEAEAEGWVVRLTRRKKGGNGRQYLPAIPGEVLREVQQLARTLIERGAERISALGSAEDAAGSAEDPSESAEDPSIQVLKISQPSSSVSSSGSSSRSTARTRVNISHETIVEGWTPPAELQNLELLVRLVREDAAATAWVRDRANVPPQAQITARDLGLLSSVDRQRLQAYIARTRGSLS